MIWISAFLAFVALCAAAPWPSHRIPAPMFGFFIFMFSMAGQTLALPLALAALVAWGFAEGYAAWLAGAATVLFSYTHWRNRHAGRVLLAAVGATGVRIPLLAGLVPFATGAGQVTRIKDLAYGDAGQRNLLDIVVPTTRPAAAMPVLVHMHGGGWTMGNKNEQAKPLLHYLARQGWMCVDLSYRLCPGDRFPTMINDVLRAIAWVKAHAHEYGGDPSRLAVTGGSAGGQLAALAALANDDPALKPGFEDADCSVQMAVPLYGVYDLLDRDHGLGAQHKPIVDRLFSEQIMPGPPDSCPALWHAMSPIDRVRADAPPMLIVHGTGDSLQPCLNARAFAETLRGVATAPATFVALPGIEHAYDSGMSALSWAHVRAVEAFLAPLAGARAEPAAR